MDEDKILFYGGGWNCFSNFSAHQVEYDGILWPTSEHAFQAAKTLSVEEKNKIKLARSPQEALMLGRSVTLRPEWELIKVEILESILRAKYTQHPSIQEKLIQSKDKELIEASPVDSFWGIGPDGTGENMCGKLWMKIREEYCPHV